MKILLDNGHGSDTAGKRSPDGKLMEYRYARDIVDAIGRKLSELSIPWQKICSEENDIDLAERVRRANEICKKESCLLISVHVDAFGRGKNWEKARGWSVFVSRNSSSNSRKLGNFFANSAEEYGCRVRKEVSGAGYWVKNLYILTKSRCPAVLTENFFMDNKDDVDFLLSDKGFQTIVDVHISAIKKYLEANE